MATIEFLRQFRIGEYALFDLTVAFLGVYLLAPLLSKLFLKIGIIVPKYNWLYLTLPIGIIVHLLVGTLTPMTKAVIDVNGYYILKIIVIILILLGLRGVRLKARTKTRNSASKQIAIGCHIKEILNQIDAARAALLLPCDPYNSHQYFLIHCVIIYNLIAPNTKPEKNKAGVEIKVQRRKVAEKRRESMQEYFGNSYKHFTTQNYASEFRNHFEHIDSRIDVAVLSGIYRDKNSYWGLDTIINPKGGDDKSSLRGYLNGKFTFNEKVLDNNKLQIWLDEIESYIKQKGVPNTGCTFIMTDNVFE
ncbi:MAG: hypothetical protein UT41_C0001G0457 [Candidatus Wolfebacteria bacterium GW2011_GWC2_39_22]|uniref:Uncharacterized protein n=1 Tax=Candidatus Wolfebacteria bacterium GW2011_GWC2_39_22 TaxID=1619013 RepID=A0A0G0NBP4_9BACT|nr:MAG: hypothetical protein UT41_C0001G0457 [Candidatus Wolfebacteria bacterium GW2011_GWC2_39_22]